MKADEQSNVLLLGGITSTNDVKWLGAELRKFTNFLMQLCPKLRIRLLASDLRRSREPKEARCRQLNHSEIISRPQTCR
ncbi:MAG: hypothetical protein K2L83_01220 [Muribaculaceae bacterium]|nr:hypothetical protein [Muribaculaceae bacterium]